MKATALLLLAVSLAAPALSQATPKRDASERVFLANCASTYDFSDRTTVVPFSEMQYYSTDAASWNNHPSAVSKLTSDAHVTWEGTTISGTFPDGDVFVSNIAAGAQDLANFEVAGSGYNDYRGFNCYKDDGRLLTHLESPNGLVRVDCYSSYYCEDA